ncbi:MAG: BON domain-containing protein [Gemmatimonadota bacterium]
MRIQRFSVIPVSLAIAAVMTVAGCDSGQENRTENRTVGQKVDSAISKVGKQADQAAAEVKKGVDTASADAGKAIDAAGNKVKDAAITASVSAELVRDPALSALKIDVDTNDGRVSLHGVAPSTDARERATQIAQRVDGVVSVDNQLQVTK